MAREMARRHRNLYHTVSRERFDSAVAALDRRIPRLERHQVIVELARIVALVGDGHTNIAPTRDSAIGFRTLPVKLYLFSDGLFIRAADRQHGPTWPEPKSFGSARPRRRRLTGGFAL